MSTRSDYFFKTLTQFTRKEPFLRLLEDTRSTLTRNPHHCPVQIRLTVLKTLL